MDDVRNRPRLAASREVGSNLWRIAAMEPIVFGLLGHTSSDLISLQLGNTMIGRADDSIRIVT